MNFTFKKHVKTGRYKSFDHDCTDIKLKGKVVGSINEGSNRKYRISFAIKKEKTEEDPAPFKWARLQAVCDDEDHARNIIRKHSAELQEKYDLYSFD